MSLTFNDYKNALNSNTYTRIPKIKVEFLRSDETSYLEVTGDIEGNSGSLTVNNQNGVRRSIEFTLINIDGKYIPSFDGLVWLRRKIKVYLGLKINNEIWYEPMGVFVLDNPSCESNPTKCTMSIKAVDKFALLDGSIGGKLDSLKIIPLGTNIYTAIKSALTTNGDMQSPILCSNYVNEVTAYTIEKEDSNWGEIIIDLAKMVSANVYYDVNGCFVFEKDINDKIKGSDWDFVEGDKNYLGATKEYKFNEVVNSVIVIGDNIDGATVRYEAQNTNLLSETSIPNLGYKITNIITDTNIAVLQYATDRANYELKRATALQSSINISCVPIYHLHEDGVITLTDSKLKLDEERLLIQGFTLPFSVNSTMSIEAVKSSELLM